MSEAKNHGSIARSRAGKFTYLSATKIYLDIPRAPTERTMYYLCYTAIMRTLDQDSFNDLLKHTTIKRRIVSELKFVKSVENLAEDWSNYELLSITDRTNEKGILLLEPATDLYAVQYELSKKVIDFKSGRRRAIICDFCYTWQSGSNAASITFSTGNSKRKVRFICCADLRCSMHVRTMTREAVMSRAQLHENMTNEDRILRLKDKLRDKITQLELTPIQAHP